MRSASFIDSIWDIACAVSIVGIWPRFIEPFRLKVTPIVIPSQDLQGFSIVQLSDLHFHPKVPSRFTQKIVQTVQKLKPDMIVFTGDFLCYGQLSEKERLLDLLKSFSAPCGCYAILGNHDYARAVSFNEAGDYDLIERPNYAPLAGLKRLFSDLVPTGLVTERARAVPLHHDLLALLKESPFKLLHNETQCVPVGKTHLNVCGLGEYMLGRFQPEIAFQNYRKEYPGIILSHNPDTIPHLKEFPGQLILCGHTHGRQVNLPWIWKKYTITENRAFARAGLYQVDDKIAYVSRGLGSVLPFRFRSCPEVVHIRWEGN